jgi:hypothetical protein
MVTLTPELRQAIDQAGFARIEDAETNTAYVIVKAEVYEKIKAFAEDDTLTQEEQESLLHEFGKRAGWDDPAMSVYDDNQP